MSQFIETIRIDHGEVQNPGYHNARFNKTRLDVLGIPDKLDLAEMISIPWHIENGVYKCRVMYAEEIELVEFMVYQRRKVESVRLIAGDHIEYSYKYADRSAIDKLFSQKEDCDDILIMKEGRITDLSTANVAFFDGHHWFTPDAPLLSGTRRQQLLDEGRIEERSIRRSDIAQYSHFAWFNAMNDFDPVNALPVSRIYG